MQYSDAEKISEDEYQPEALEPTTTIQKPVTALSSKPSSSTATLPKVHFFFVSHLPFIYRAELLESNLCLFFFHVCKSSSEMFKENSNIAVPIDFLHLFEMPIFI